MKDMPRGDGTGPRGLGSMTGRAAGYCAGYPIAGFMNPCVGRSRLGFGYGRGFGRGYGRGSRYGNTYPIPYFPQVYGGELYQPPTEPKQEMEMLVEEARYLKEQLETINKRITELEKSEKK